MIQYYHREHYDGSYSVVKATKKQVGNWFTRHWIIAHKEIIATGVTFEEAQTAMKESVLFNKGNIVKSITTYNSRGDLYSGPHSTKED